MTKNSGTKKRKEARRNKAMRLMQSFKAKGYDHTSLMQVGEPFGRIYWISGCVLPLYEIKMQCHRQCGICLEDILMSKAWGCSSGHFLCAECFCSYAKSTQEPGTMRRIVDEEGNLACPHDGCEKKYVIPYLLRQSKGADEEEVQSIHSELEKLKIAVHSRRDIKAALKVQKMELEAEFQRIQQIMNLEEREAEILRLEIIDSILTLRCPNPGCRLAFLDFDGCFAVRCQHCRCEFCAWCTTYYNMSDAHRHVAHCSESNGAGIYSTMQVFNRHHNARRRRRIIEKLRGKGQEIQKLTLARLGIELRDLGIVIALNEC